MNSIKSRLILPGILLLLAIFLAGCDGIDPNQQKTAAGVVVKGYSNWGYIENTNSFPVKIQEVWVFHGESTKWIKIFKPQEKLSQFISHQHGFYILDLEDRKLGYIFVGNY